MRPGDRAPDFSGIGQDWKPVNLASSAGKTRLFVVVPSLDTSVCDLEAREFSRRADEIDGVEIVVVSVDLPPAQARWCGAAGVRNLTLVSDHREVSFGTGYGVLVKETRMLCRAILVVDARDTVTYVEYVPQIGLQPDYDAAIAAARAAAAA
ncbi:MAG: thiol peroxidase [Gemmatimonadetes bacterium]|nr:thiol peroxidase [Gemmatimonadota bacterium]